MQSVSEVIWELFDFSESELINVVNFVFIVFSWKLDGVCPYEYPQRL